MGGARTWWWGSELPPAVERQRFLDAYLAFNEIERPVIVTVGQSFVWANRQLKVDTRLAQEHSMRWVRVYHEHRRAHKQSVLLRIERVSGGYITTMKGW